MLKIALGYGVVFIVTACLLAIYNRLGDQPQRRLFGHHGVVNLVFYLALVWGG
jgi:V/A-type H+-transporting ATPase subunit I